MVSFSVDLEGFSWRFNVEAAPRVPRARRLKVEVGSGTLTVILSFSIAPVTPGTNVWKLYTPGSSPVIFMSKVRLSPPGTSVQPRGSVQLKRILSPDVSPTVVGLISIVEVAVLSGT